MMKEARIVSVVPLFPLPQYVIVLEDIDKTRLVPIWIGVNEGNAIAIEMQGEKFPRPLTHDLFVNVLQELGATIERVVVSDLKENSYFAVIHLKTQGKMHRVDARPSDSLALAVRVKCPIFIDEKVLKKCPLIDKPITKDEIERFKTQLKKMSPEEFFSNLEKAPPRPDPTIQPGAGSGEEESFEDDQEEEGESDEPRDA